MKIAVAGTGYVGLSIATLLAQHNDVVAVDILKERVEMINQGISPIQDDYIEEYMRTQRLRLRATLNDEEAYRDARFVVIAVPTNYDPALNHFDTHNIEDVIERVLSVNPAATMVIKSTVPVGKGPLEIRARLKEMKRNFAFINAEISHEGIICSTCEMVYCTFSKEVAEKDFYFRGCSLEEE